MHENCVVNRLGLILINDIILNRVTQPVKIKISIVIKRMPHHNMKHSKSYLDIYIYIYRANSIV